MKKCVRIRVTGKVQGVLYRRFVQKHAEKLEVEGTVQNMEDGSVIIMACGVSEKLDDLVDFLYQGSGKSKIENVMVEPLYQGSDFRGVFRVIGG